MVKTQIQLSDELYRELKRFAAEREWSLAETLRRAAEQLLRLYPKETAPLEEWSLPPAQKCGRFLLPQEQWTEIAHEAAH